jgi:hypothetical protein
MHAQGKPVVINVRICSQFNDFLAKKGLAPDFEIVGEGITEPLPAHRILVASACTWFSDELSKPANQISPANPTKLPQIRLPENPDRLFRDFLEILYTGKVTVEDSNILGLLKIASFYGAPKYRDIFRHFLHVSLDRVQAHIPAVYRTLVDFARKLVEWDLEDDGVLLAPILASGPPLALTSSPERATLFSALSPRIFAELLTYAPYPTWPVNDLMQLIEQYLYEEQQGKPVLRYQLSPTEKASLAKLIDWGASDDFRLFGKFHCGWVPDDIAAPRLAALLEKRDVVLNKIARSTKTIPQISPWYIATGLCACGSGTVTRAFNVPIFRFIRTLGMSGEGINPLQWRLLKVSSTGTSVEVKKPGAGNDAARVPLFPPENLFSRDKYFLAYRKEKCAPPEVRFEFPKPIGITVCGAIVDTNPRQPGDIKRLQQLPGAAGAARTKPSPEKLTFKFDKASVDVPIDPQGRSPLPVDNQGHPQIADAYGLYFHELQPVQTTAFSVAFSHGEAKAHRVARLSYVELNGEFVAEYPPKYDK